MKQIYLKFSMLLLCLVVGLSSAWGEDTYYERCNDVSEIINYKEYIIVISSGTKHYAVQQNSTNFLEITTESDGTIKNPSGLIVWEASSESGKISFKCGTKYIYSNGSNTTLSAAGNNPTNWVISELSTGVFKMNIGDISGRYLAWSGSKFAAYANSNFVNQFKDNSSFGQYSGALYIYKVKKSVKTTPTFSITNITVDYGDKITPVITTNNTDEYIISYSSNKEDVVLADGDELVTMGEGEATITATMASTKNFNETQTAFTVTVNVAKTLTELTVSGTPTKTSYYAGDKFETAGLVVTGTYSDGTSKQLTEGVEWTVDPEILTAGTTSVDVLAGIGEVVSDVFTVNGLSVTESLYKTATISSFSKTSDDINNDIVYEAQIGDAGTAPAVYNNCLRLYQNGAYVTIKANSGLKIASVKITTSATYASTTVGYCVDDEDAPTTGKTVEKSSDYTISNLNNQSVSIYCLGDDKNTRLEIAAIEVKYSGTAITELKSIALSGTYPTEFTKGDEFSHEGMTITATYTDGTTKNVTSEATFTGYDISKVGEQTVTVNYTEGEITKTAEYTITVARKMTPAAEGYETVDFTKITDYSSLSQNQSKELEDYQGTSFDMVFSKPQSSSTPTRYYESGNSVRAYKGNTITITAAEEIKNVRIAWTKAKGEDTEVAITGIGTTTAVVTFSNTCSFDRITVYYKTVGTISISDKEWVTYYTDKAYIMPEGAKGVTITAYRKDNGNYTLTLTDAYEAGSVVPANTPLLINAAQGNYDLYPTSETGSSAEDNLLRGQLEAGQIQAEVGDYYYYKLTTGSVAPNVGKLGFYWGEANGGVFNLTGNNRAYLVLPQSIGIKAFAFDGMETAISTLLSSESLDAPKYNVAGQRIVAPVRGQIYIQNGKKYIAK